jgi:hypothetical protein
MAILQGFPMVSQLTQVTSDGRPSENAQFDCVPAAIGAGLLWFEGKTAWDTEINPDLLKDAVYGEAWKQQGTAASAYVSFCQSRGVRLYAVNVTPAQLVVEAHKHIQQGHPVMFTEPDRYVSSSLGWSHVGVFYSEEAGFLTAMDPYIARPVRRTDSEWTQLLLFNQIWILERSGEDVPKILSIAEVASDFKELDAHHWQCINPNAPYTGKVIQYALLDNYKTYGNSGLCGRQFLGLPCSNELYIGKDDVVQFYQFGVQRWKSGKMLGPVDLYAAGSPGNDPYIAQLEKVIQQMKTQAQTNDPQATQALNVVKQAQPIVNQLQQLFKPF